NCICSYSKCETLAHLDLSVIVTMVEMQFAIRDADSLGSRGKMKPIIIVYILASGFATLAAPASVFANEPFRMTCAVTKQDPHFGQTMDHFEIHGDLTGELVLDAFVQDESRDHLAKQTVTEGKYEGYFKVAAYPKKIHRITWGDDGDDQLDASPEEPSNDQL